MSIRKKVRVTTDCHTHCLPGVDDGAVDVAASLAMLTEAGRQGVTTVVATPHFYPGQIRIDDFLQRRQKALATLLPQLPPDAPRLLTGAEVLVRQGISRLDLRPLCIEGTDWLLVEMPFMAPPYWLVEELENITFEQRLTLVMAHVDRYMPWYSKERIAAVTDFPDLIMQLNGEAFLHRRQFARLRQWLPEPQRLLLGSDMHNMSSRAPNLEQAAVTLSTHRVGRQWLACAEETASELLR